jgi:Fe2+ or Zn2+ uptake regulation protein
MTYMMLDADIVAVSPSTVYRLLQNAGVLHRWNTNKNSRKGQGFQQPLKAHEHWHNGSLLIFQGIELKIYF